MAACAGLGLGVLIERLARLRKHKIIPAEFTAGFLDRLYEGRLDCGERSIIASDTQARRHESRWPRSAAGAGRPPTSSGRLRWHTALRASA